MKHVLRFATLFAVVEAAIACFVRAVDAPAHSGSEVFWELNGAAACIAACAVAGWALGSLEDRDVPESEIRDEYADHGAFP